MRRVLPGVVVLVLVGLAGMARAEDKADPTGTWKWTVQSNNGDREVTLKLKLDGDKLTGSMPGRNNRETKIEDGTFKDSEVTFKVTRERNGQKTVITYKGKVSGDTIKGKIETDRDGETRSRDWEAKRSKD
jgi:hypothetical protein